MEIIDGRWVWQLHATHGLALDVSLPLLAERGLVPAWDGLLLAAEADGADVGRLVGQLQAVAVDAYPPPACDVIARQLPTLWVWLTNKRGVGVDGPGVVSEVTTASHAHTKPH